jgi:hypothetical protein
MAMDPDNGEEGVSYDRTSMTVYYNQPMKNSGGGGSVERPEHYRLRRVSTNSNLTIISRIYNPDNFSLVFTFDHSNNWEYGELYQIRVQGSVQNACNTSQGGDVYTTFRVEDYPPGNLNETISQPVPVFEIKHTANPHRDVVQKDKRIQRASRQSVVAYTYDVHPTPTITPTIYSDIIQPDNSSYQKNVPKGRSGTEQEASPIPKPVPIPPKERASDSSKYLFSLAAVSSLMMMSIKSKHERGKSH